MAHNALRCEGGPENVRVAVALASFEVIRRAQPAGAAADEETHPRVFLGLNQRVRRLGFDVPLFGSLKGDACRVVSIRPTRPSSASPPAIDIGKLETLGTLGRLRGEGDDALAAGRKPVDCGATPRGVALFVACRSTLCRAKLEHALRRALWR
jgi:hypothetical protein